MLCRSYLFISFFIMFNALLAIIVGAYDEVQQSIKMAHKDPLPFLVYSKLHPGQNLTLSQLDTLLDAWVGDKLDLRVQPGDDLDATLARLTKPPRTLEPRVQDMLKTRRLLQLNKNLLLKIRASEFDPVVVLDVNMLELVARVFSAYYLSCIDPAKLTIKANLFRKERKIVPLDRFSSIKFAVNVLARYGSASNSGTSAYDPLAEATAIRKLVHLLPLLTDESLTAEHRLTFAYRYFCGLVRPVAPHCTHTLAGTEYGRRPPLDGSRDPRCCRRR